MKKMISAIERGIKTKSVLVVGDFFLDKYIYMKDDETGKSLYSYGPAYKIEKTVCSPGAAGTVVKNFANLGYEAVYALGIVGEDGDGFSLRKALRSFPNVTDMLISVSDRNTPSYTMIMRDQGKGFVEFGEASVQNYQPTAKSTETEIIDSMKTVINSLKPDAVVIIDQLDQEDCGVVTKEVRNAIAVMKEKHPEIMFYMDSRQFINSIDSTVIRKCNNIEFERAYNVPASKLSTSATILSNDIPFIVTMGVAGTAIALNGNVNIVPSVMIDGDVDTRGAGDAFTAGYITARLCEVDELSSVELGNYSAACCVSQIASTGHTSFEHIRQMVIHNGKKAIQNEI